MSRPVPGLKHSNSTLSLNTLPMWDSSDPDRHPPPLPLNPDSPNLSGSPTRNSQLYGSTRSRTVSPVRQTMKPAMPLNPPGSDFEILQILSKIQDMLKDVDSTSKLSDATIRKAEKDVDSLLRRSKDNAVDLVSLRDKIYSSEILLSHQLQDIHDILSKEKHPASDNSVTVAICADYLAKIDELKALLYKESTLVRGLLNSNSGSQADSLQSLNDSLSFSNNQLFAKLDSLMAQLRNIEKTHVEYADQERDINIKTISALNELQQLITKDDKAEQILTEIRKSGRVADGNTKYLMESCQTIQELLNALSRSALDDKDVMAAQMHTVNTNITCLRDHMVQKHDAAPADVIRSSQEQVSEALATFQGGVTSSLQTVLSSLEPERIITAIEDLKSFIATRSDSSLESTIHEHEKLDQILKDIGILSSTLAPLSLLPEVHTSFLESATQFNSYIIGENSNLMDEVETLRQEKLRLVSEVSALESVVATRSEQLAKLEERAEKFQQRLTDHIFQKSLKGAVAIEGRESVHKSSRSTLDVLTESPGPESNLANITNSVSVYAGHATPEDRVQELSISDASSFDASRSLSGGSANRRVSWSKKIGTMFGSGKENELFIPKRGGARKAGKGRSVSERL
ncbi:hypothetical protein POJ06DRAFT_34854 [Lipomyces tetrasporus]|uniref:Uncharacterized protein n=1 Tax=Lipomyces tetrasporus TaxID=54092 RepID=A0AAD7VPA7_9ASCO|nr:uncharacterized protein POJ06DRAFT_34854 [Lipomyces tetrasporus]KAJ8097582.1 hypothetical protein POJ06DRAFT_34854 [Lipomyces tetrasporus]